MTSHYDEHFYLRFELFFFYLLAKLGNKASSVLVPSMAHASVLSIALVVAALSVSTTLATQDWAPWSTLPVPASMQCTVCIIQEAVIMGGRRDDGISDAVDAIDVSNPLVIMALSPALPIHSTGQFCARAGNTLFVSIQGSGLAPVSPIPDYSVYYATFGVNGNIGYATSSSWRSLGHGKYNRTRAGIGAADGELSVFVFGGQDPNQQYVNLIEAYNTTVGRWIPMGYMPRASKDFANYCNCQTAMHRYTMILVCQLCNPQPVQRGLVQILQFDLETSMFSPNSLQFDFGWYFLSLRSVSLSHYVIMTVSVSNATNPIMYYYDVYQNQVSYVMTSDFPAQRSHGSVFPITFSMYFAGGEYPNGTLSDEVDAVSALPSIAVVVDHTNYTYFVGQNITFSIGECTPGLRIRIATTPSCNINIPGGEDLPCNSTIGGNGEAMTVVNEAFNGASICLAMGYCTQVINDMVPCPGPVNTNFEDCLYASCCWNAASNQCFSYSAGDSENLHFFLVNVNPLDIVWPPEDTESAFVRFITSVSGIITAVVVALVLIVGAGSLAWRMLKAGTEEEEEEGSAHPLDQHGKYKVLCKLGQGGFGTVYLVARKSDSERFAMKYIVCKDEEERNYAIKEFELLHSSQGHPNMIRLTEMFMNWTDEAESLPSVNYSEGNEDDPTQARLLQLQRRSTALSSASSRSTGTRSSSKKSRKSDAQMPLLQMAPKYVCIVMDYCPEGDLAHYILRVHQLGSIVAESMILQVLEQCCSLLSHLHSLKPPIVHRDLKPENLLLRDNGTHVIVTDFGLAQQIEKSYLTTRAGSLHYVAPECWKRHYTAAVDVWALGCIAYGMATGRVSAETARVMFSDARDKNFDRAIRYDLRNYSEKLRNIVMGMLQTTPAKRLTTTQVLQVIATDDGRLMDGADTSAPSSLKPAHPSPIKKSNSDGHTPPQATDSAPMTQPS